MRIKNAKHWCDVPKRRRAIWALATFSAIFVLQIFVHPLLGKYFPYQLFFYGGCLATFFLGWMSGAAVMLLGTVAESYFFIEPYYQFTEPTPRDFIFIGNYLVSCLLIITAIEYLQRARYKNELLLRVSESRYKTLLHRDNLRMVLERQALEAKTN